MAAKNRETNIIGLIIDKKSRVICQNVRCLNVYLIWPLNAILIILIWPQKSKMAAQNCKTNITWLVINLRSRVICQNVCFIYIYIYKYTTIHDFYDFDIATKIQNGRQRLLNKHNWVHNRLTKSCKMSKSSFPKYGYQTRDTILNFNNFNIVAWIQNGRQKHKWHMWIDAFNEIEMLLIIIFYFGVII